MDEQFEHPHAVALLSEVRNTFEHKPVFQNQRKPVIFLCGGPLNPPKANMRSEFLHWASKRFPEIMTLIAEDAYRHTKIYDPPQTVKLYEIEAIINTPSDYVLFFPD